MLFQSDEIWKVIESINSEEFSPKLGFRRNKSIYELVCYVNNIIGCYLSKRSEVNLYLSSLIGFAYI